MCVWGGGHFFFWHAYIGLKQALNFAKKKKKEKRCCTYIHLLPQKTYSSIFLGWVGRVSPPFACKKRVTLTVLVTPVLNDFHCRLGLRRILLTD